MKEQFDTKLPSPLAPLAALRSSAAGSVVRGVGFDDVQSRAYVETPLEQSIIDLARSEQNPPLIVFSGSAGGGKSAVIRRVLDMDPDAFGECIQDATHSETPDEAQVVRLARFLAPFADGAQPPTGRTRLLAMNTGMALRFLKQVSDVPGAPAFTALGSLLRHRLAVKGGGLTGTWMDDGVVVVNLDMRPTAGGPDSLLPHMLSSLRPGRDGGLLGDTRRCDGCGVRGWCWPTTNADLMSQEPVRDQLDEAVSAVAMLGGRDVPPRALWDFVAGAVFGGDTEFRDPCFDVAAAAQAGDLQGVADRLVIGRALERLVDSSDIGARVLAIDPTFRTDERTHDLVADAGIDPAADSRLVLEYLDDGQHDRLEALLTVAEAAADATVALSGRTVARAAWLAGRLAVEPAGDPRFRRALQSLDAADDPVAEHGALDLIAAGLARGFGDEAGVESFLPTDRPGEDRAVRVLVAADLRGALVELAEDDPLRAANPVGARIVGYRPLALPLRIGPDDNPRDVAIDLPHWDLLVQASEGTMPGTVDLERFIGMRRAVEAASRSSATDMSSAFLIADTRTGRRWRLAPVRGRGGEQHRVYEVQ